MMKHIEMIIDYITDGTDFQYNDNHGVLVRCKDCKFYVPEDDGRCDVIEQFDLPEMFFCGNGERGDSE